jgi:glutaredoxin
MAGRDGGHGSVVSDEATPARNPVSRKQLLGLGVLLFAVSTVQTWWANRHDDRLGESVAALAEPGDIRMFSSETCAPCQLARQWLVEHRVSFQECLIERDPACRAELEASGALGTPLFKIRGQTQMGFNAEAMKKVLADAPRSKDL